MAHYDVEIGFISKYLETKDALLVKDMQIKRSFFSGDNKLYFKSSKRNGRNTKRQGV